MRTSNIFSGIPATTGEESTEKIIRSGTAAIERIISRGHSSPPGFWYDQDDNEWVILLKGRAGLLFQGDREPTILTPGDYVNIPAHLKHRIEWTDPAEETVWLAIRY
ncbi:MAG: cupin domain-containing protein [Candidatus Aureabacteria bacterium]|nr:cupin domain-containing protein [Candidatus Auribacterota bacterium]